MKKTFSRLVIGVITATSMFSPISVFATDGKFDPDFYSNNDIVIYNPTDTSCTEAVGGSLGGAAPTSLTGSTNQEKVWNYFLTRGLTPVAAAGAMGNIQQESSFHADEQESTGVGLGIIQWSYGRRTNLENAAKAAGINLSDNDSALLFELNYLWSGEYNAMTWQQQVNAETTVDGNTAIASYNSSYTAQLAPSQAGNGSTMVFHALVERSGDTPDMLTTRIKNAEGFLTQFGGGASSGGGGCSTIGAGGLTWDQATVLAKKIVDNWDTNYCGPGSIKNNFYCDWKTGYCTAGAAWMAVTTSPNPGKVPGIPNGVDVAHTLFTSNPDVYAPANPDGSNIQPFSIWSFGDGSSGGEPGHTGTIVGVGTDGSIITLETNWSGATMPGATQNFAYTGAVSSHSGTGHRVAVFDYPSFDVFTKSHHGYVYNATATPKDSATAAQMALKIKAYLGGS